MIGSTRRVEKHATYVVKYARNRIGIAVNKAEWHNWVAYSGSPYLCPITMHSEDFGWIIMPRVQIPKLWVRLKHARLLRRMLRQYRIQDIHFYNIGELDGTPVLYDYGGMWISLSIIREAWRLAK